MTQTLISRVAVVLACWLLPGVVLAAPAAGLRILQHEALQVVADAGGRELEIEVYGRRFRLHLQRNERIRFVDARRTPRVEPLRGTIDGQPGSWVRLTRTPTGLYGLMSDGRDFYAIEPAAAVAPHAIGPVAAKGMAPVVYRLADTVLPAGEASCGVVSPREPPALPMQSAQQALDAVGEELQALAAILPDRQIEVAVVGDAAFGGLSFAGGLTPEAAIAARMNVVDGIYSSQIGVKIVVGEVTVFRGGSDPFSTTTVPNTLLGELGNWRRNTPAQAAHGLTHLLTGRDLDGTTVGIAYLGSLCNARSGASLSQGTLSQINSALIIAHEMGHNFGAPHDGEAGSVCESAPQTFLMAPRLNGNDRFSSCSLERIAAAVATAACITAFESPDASIDLPAMTVRPLRGVSFDYRFYVHSIGSGTVDDVVATVTLPAGLVLESSSIAGGAACSGGPTGSLSCALGSLPTQTRREIVLTLRARQFGAPTLQVSLRASNDGLAANDSAQVTLNIDPSADLSVELATV
ncbi:MAG: hypothetical protein KDI08_08265, partial [Pseudomonadales bacterium]|nr:hypothetical protein [Pseudomonadales bacterium]